MEKRRKVKDKGEREIYTQLNADFQRMARRNKQTILSQQCKEIEGDNRMGKTRDIIKKIRQTKETFHAKMSTSVCYSEHSLALPFFEIEMKTDLSQSCAHC